MYSYEELFYRSYTDEELRNLCLDPKQLGAFKNRCELELRRRQEEQDDILGI